MEGRYRVRRDAAGAVIRQSVLASLALVCGVASAQSVEELRQGIAERDATIRELRERIKVLEGVEDPGSGLAANAPADPRPARDESATAAEDEELSRALERTLVQQGGLLLPPGSYELQPEASYAHWDKSRGPLRRESVAALTLRAGLPWESQFQVRVPYVHTVVAGGSAAGLGDIDLSLSRQLAQEKAGWPGLVGSIGWSARTGRENFSGGAATGSGFNVLHGDLTAIKRHDPLMFYGGVSYASAFARRISGVDTAPGDSLGLRLGGVLAASPDVAVNIGLNLGFVRPVRFNGQPLPDSDTVIGTLQIGVGTVLTRSMLLNVSTDLRITGRVPDFRLGASLPIRF